jgi:hypothetical protein
MTRKTKKSTKRTTQKHQRKKRNDQQRAPGIKYYDPRKQYVAMAYARIDQLEKSIQAIGEARQRLIQKKPTSLSAIALQRVEYQGQERIKNNRKAIKTAYKTKVAVDKRSASTLAQKDELARKLCKERPKNKPKDVLSSGAGTKKIEKPEKVLAKEKEFRLWCK